MLTEFLFWSDSMLPSIPQVFLACSRLTFKALICGVVVLFQPVAAIPELDMHFPAGMQSNASGNLLYNVSRDWMSASSYDPSRDPRLGAGRLHNTSENAAWEPTASTPYEYLEVAFPGPTTISSLQIQGSEKADGGQITSFHIHYSFDGIEYKIYMIRDVPRLFECTLRNGTEDLIFNETLDNSTVQGYPLRAQYIRIVPQSWYLKIAIRIEYFRKVVCGDGFLDFLEGCDDTNILSGDGCSGYDGKHTGTPLGPCEIEVETVQTDLSGVRTFVTGFKTASVAPQTFGAMKILNQCNPSSNCHECAQLRTTFPTQTRDESTLEYWTDPNYAQFCAGQKPAAFLHPDDPADIPLTRNDDGHYYRTTDPRAQTDEHGFHSSGLRLYTDFD